MILTILLFFIAVAAYLNTQQPIPQQEVPSNEVSHQDPEEIDFFQGYDQQVADKEQGTDLEAMNNEETQQQVADSSLTMANATNSEIISATITKKNPEALENNEMPVNKILETDYFTEEKLLREQSRAQQVDQLTEYVANKDLDQEAKAEAAANLIEIQERIEKESSAEALLKAKGFEEVYVRIDDDTVDVVVNKPELTDSEIAQIEEVVNRKTGYSVTKINITPLNGVAKN